MSATIQDKSGAPTLYFKSGSTKRAHSVVVIDVSACWCDRPKAPTFAPPEGTDEGEGLNPFQHVFVDLAADRPRAWMDEQMATVTRQSLVVDRSLRWSGGAPG
jgi:hypothetical protein